MANHRFLKSIRPVNLLSFGPNTPEIELRPLNILIGPNGCGKSNLIEILGLLRSLTEKKPWTRVIETGGHLEWIWKGRDRSVAYDGDFDAGIDVESAVPFESRELEEVDFSYRIRLDAGDWRSTFAIREESLVPSSAQTGELKSQSNISRTDEEIIYPQDSERTALPSSRPAKISSELSLLSQFPWEPRIAHFKSIFERIALYRDWVFGSDSKTRALEQVGMESTYLEEDGSNLAHILNFILTHESNFPGDNLRKAFRDFSNDAKDIETRIREGFIQLRIRESSGISTPSIRMSDGTLRWLALLAILLNPSPGPIICIEEPELGLHPDMFPTLADLLVDASTRTQLIVTTHSDSLLDAFTETPDVVCVCEKVEGSTVIRRLDKERLKVWLDDYSLGHLWASGEIGGNRW